MNDRLAVVYKELEYRGLVQSQADFGRQMGLSRSLSHKYLNGQTKLNIDFVNKLETVFRVNKDFVLNGTGPIFIAGLSPKDFAYTLGVANEPDIAYGTPGEVVKSPFGKVPVKAAAGEPVSIPFYDVDFQAGNGGEFIDTNTVPDYYMDVRDFRGCVAFRAYSDSMAPMILSGNVVFGKKIEGWGMYLEYGQIYGITMLDGRRFLKIIGKSLKDGFFALRSQNPAYEEFEVPKDQIKNIWLIMGWMNRRM